jgi:flagellar motor component MotA
MILLVGYVLTGFVSRAVLIAAVNSGYHYAKLLAEAIRLLLTVLVLAMVLEQLKVAPGIVLAAFSIIFGGIVLALAISFGVGGIDAAKRVIERETAEKSKEEKKDDIEHI